MGQVVAVLILSVGGGIGVRHYFPPFPPRLFAKHRLQVTPLHTREALTQCPPQIDISPAKIMGLPVFSLLCQ